MLAASALATADASKIDGSNGALQQVAQDTVASAGASLVGTRVHTDDRAGFVARRRVFRGAPIFLLPDDFCACQFSLHDHFCEELEDCHHLVLADPVASVSVKCWTYLVVNRALSFLELSFACTVFVALQLC